MSGVTAPDSGGDGYTSGRTILRNAVQIGMGVAVVLGGAAGGALVYGESRRARLLGLALIVLLLVILGLMQWWSASSFDASCGGEGHARSRSLAV